MERKKRIIRTEVDASLVRQMQAGVAGASLETLDGAFALREPGVRHKAFGAPPSPNLGAPHTGLLMGGQALRRAYQEPRCPFRARWARKRGV